MTVVFGVVHRNKITQNAQTLLNSVSFQKSEQIRQWQNRHLVEADEFGHTIETIVSVKALVRDNSKKAGESLLLSFENFAQTYKYSDSMVVRPDLSIAVSTSAMDMIDPAIKKYFGTAAESGSALMTDMYLMPPYGKPGCAIIIPIFEIRATKTPIGYIVHFIDAEKDFYPIITSWPVPSETAECLIVSLNQNQVLFMNNLRYMPKAAFSFALPVDGKPTVETMGALGKTGFLTGKNYRGKTVYAYARKVQGTGWILVAEIEGKEVMRPWWSVFFLLGATLVAGTVAAIFAVIALLHRRSSRNYKKQLESEKKLRATESKFYAFMDYMPSMVLIKDKESRILYANRETRNHFPVDNWIGKCTDEIFDTVQAEISRSNDVKALADGYFEYEESRIDTSDKTLLLWTQEFRIDQDGGDPLLGQIMTDISERSRAVRQIRELNATLEQKVRERAAQVEASNAELQAFTYSVSHDLRSPLRSLDGFSELLADNYSNVLDEQGMHYLSRIRFASKRMADLINDLLSLSKVSNVDLRKESVDIGKIADSIISGYIRNERERIVSISIKPTMIATCDAQLLNILFQCLIDNAFKFTAGRPKTAIDVGSIKNHAAFPDKIVYYVKDNGVGFDMVYKDTLFQPFHRLHAAEEFPGNGIGLSIVKRIVDRHGGSIWLESETGKGTVVFFTLE